MNLMELLTRHMWVPFQVLSNNMVKCCCGDTIIRRAGEYARTAWVRHLHDSLRKDGVIALRELPDIKEVRLIQNEAGDWHWVSIGLNGEPTGSGETHPDKRDAKHSAEITTAATVRGIDIKEQPYEQAEA